MKVPKRFALSTMLLVMLLVSLVFGYAQWRKHWLKQEIKELKRTGTCVFRFSDSWFWPTVSSNAVIVLQRWSDGTYIVADKTLNHDEAMGYYHSIRARLKAIGVKDVDYGMESIVRKKEPIISTFDFNEPGK